jgi:hypothetical protein
MLPLLVKLTVDPSAVEVGARPAPVTATAEFTVAVTPALNDWRRSLVAGLGLVALVVLVVVVFAAQVRMTGLLPVVVHAATALSGKRIAKMPTANAAPPKPGERQRRDIDVSGM